MLLLRRCAGGKRQFQRRDFALLRLDFQRHRAIQRRRVKLRAGDDGVALIHRAQFGGHRALRTFGPADDGTAGTRGAHPFKVPQDALCHAFARRDQLAGAARAGSQFAHEGFGHRAAHAHGENPVPGLFCRADNRLPVIDFAVGDQKHVRRLFRAQYGVSLLQGGADFRAAQVCVQRLCKAPGAGEVFLVAGQRVVGKHFGRRTKSDHRHAIVRLHGFQNTFQRLFRLHHRLAGHGAGTIDHNRKIQRVRLLQAGEKRLKTRHRCDAFAILPTEDKTARSLCRLHIEDEIAVHHRLLLRQRNHHFVLLAVQRHLMRRAGKLRFTQRAAHFHTQRKAVFHRQRNFRRLVRGEVRAPVARRNRGRQEKAQPLARPAVEHGVAKRNLHHFLRQHIADVHGVQAGFGFFQHHCRIARLQRVFVSFFRLPFFHHRAFQMPRADFDGQIQQHGIQRQGKGVDRFDVGRLVVAVGLRDGDFRQQVLQHGAHRHVAQRDALARPSAQSRCLWIHCVSSR